MQPDGVKRHVVTNGVYDTTDADPGAEDSGDEIRRGPKQLPLRQGQWNHCRLHLNGDVLEIHLNEQLVAAYPLPLDGDRGFGLFHYSDRTQSRVHNIIWRGDWPKTAFGAGELQLLDQYRNPLDQGLEDPQRSKRISQMVSPALILACQENHVRGRSRQPNAG